MTGKKPADTFNDPPILNTKSVRKGDRLKSRSEKKSTGKKKTQEKNNSDKQQAVANETDKGAGEKTQTTTEVLTNSSSKTKPTQRPVRKKSKKGQDLTEEQLQEVAAMGAYEGERLI